MKAREVPLSARESKFSNSNIYTSHQPGNNNKKQTMRNRVQSAAPHKRSHTRNQGPNSIMMESAPEYPLFVPQKMPQQLHQSDLEELRSRLAQFINSMKSEKKMDAK
jgi:hypothetical protein